MQWGIVRGATKLKTSSFSGVHYFITKVDAVVLGTNSYYARSCISTDKIRSACLCKNEMTVFGLKRYPRRLQNTAPSTFLFEPHIVTATFLLMSFMWALFHVALQQLFAARCSEQRYDQSFIDTPTCLPRA